MLILGRTKLNKTLATMRVVDKEAIYRKVLVVVFDVESKAYAGSGALNQLDRDGSIAIHA